MTIEQLNAKYSISGQLEFVAGKGGLPMIQVNSAKAKALIIPGSPDTFGHGTTGNARFWKKEVGELMQSAPRLAR